MRSDTDKLRSRGSLWISLGFGALLAVGLLCVYPGEVSYGLVWILGILGSWIFFFGIGSLIYGFSYWAKYIAFLDKLALRFKE